MGPDCGLVAAGRELPASLKGSSRVGQSHGLGFRVLGFRARAYRV